MNPPVEEHSKQNIPGQPAAQSKTMRSQLLGGSLTLLAGSGLVGVTNLIYNVATARLLGPAGFAHATAVYTILMLLSAITLSYQVVCAKYVARRASDEDASSIFASLHQRAWITGIGIGLLLVVFAGPLTRYLNLPHTNLIRLLALGTAFYIPLGVRRGYIQGVHKFGPLAINFLLEGVVRVVGVFLLIGAGLGVPGAVLASVLAVILAYFFAKPSPGVTSIRFRGMANSFREAMQAVVFFSGQTIINNFDIVLVKHFFLADQAGLYAAVALVGRLVNMCAWSVVNTMFPVSAGKTSDESEARPVLILSLALVFLILTILIVGLCLVPSFLWRTIFGVRFAMDSTRTLPQLLILYAVTAGVYSLSSVIITYEMSRKIANTGWVQLAFSGVFIAGICIFHETLRQVILVQLVLMIALLAVLAVPLLRYEFTAGEAVRKYGAIRVLRPLTEEEVIAEFLRSEFHYPEFDEYRADFGRIVTRPDLTNLRENELRRALLFLRRGAMWRELPADTKWFAVGLTMNDLNRVRFFPRAQWRRVAKGSFYAPEILEQIRLGFDNSENDEFFNKLRRLSASFHGGPVNPTVLLIGVDERGPLTILDGNHRMAAAMLTEPLGSLNGLHFICGFSPKMTRCCWYYTNLNTLLRYFKNLVRYFTYDPEIDISRYQRDETQG
ncbi:MAG TPA: oligosaccharide flippase family protein [Terriglobales bacterium]|nr:oligosaccharide flippase family protein [Terriglobales bacterium]